MPNTPLAGPQISHMHHGLLRLKGREIAMRRVLRFVLWGLISVVALGGALFGYFVYSPVPEVPRLSGTLTKGTIEVGGLKRTYLRAAGAGERRTAGSSDARLG
jgi:hypothetical protein